MEVETAAFGVAAPGTEILEDLEHVRTSRGITAPQIVQADEHRIESPILHLVQHHDLPSLRVALKSQVILVVQIARPCENGDLLRPCVERDVRVLDMAHNGRAAASVEKRARRAHGKPLSALPGEVV